MTKRIDDISVYYKPVNIAEIVLFIIFLFMTILSILIPNIISNEYEYERNILQIIFLITIMASFLTSMILRFRLVPYAESMRRKQLLSDSYGTPLTTKRTVKYYNNYYPPGPSKLGTNILENSFFSKSICNHMLIKKRISTAILLFIWLAVVFYRNSSFDLLLWITQLAFGSGLIVSWINLEILESRFNEVYDHLYTHFHQNVGDTGPESVALILNEFSSYESAKSAASITLSTKIFNEKNEELSAEWEEIKSDLKM